MNAGRAWDMRGLIILSCAYLSQCRRSVPILRSGRPAGSWSTRPQTYQVAVRQTAIMPRANSNLRSGSLLFQLAHSSPVGRPNKNIFNCSLPNTHNSTHYEHKWLDGCTRSLIGFIHLSPGKGRCQLPDYLRQYEKRNDHPFKPRNKKIYPWMMWYAAVFGWQK